MRAIQKRPFTRLRIEELEPRSMLAVSTLTIDGAGFPIDPTPDTVSGLFASATPGAPGALNITDGMGPAGSTGTTTPTGSLDSAGTMSFTGIADTRGPNSTSSIPGAAAGIENPTSRLGFDATSGNGQITLTTGAGTPGISSFAMSTTGVAMDY